MSIENLKALEVKLNESGGRRGRGRPARVNPDTSTGSNSVTKPDTTGTDHTGTGTSSSIVNSGRKDTGNSNSGKDGANNGNVAPTIRRVNISGIGDQNATGNNNFPIGDNSRVAGDGRTSDRTSNGTSGTISGNDGRTKQRSVQSVSVTDLPDLDTSDKTTPAARRTRQSKKSGIDLETVTFGLSCFFNGLALIFGEHFIRTPEECLPVADSIKKVIDRKAPTVKSFEKLEEYTEYLAVAMGLSILLKEPVEIELKKRGYNGTKFTKPKAQNIGTTSGINTVETPVNEPSGRNDNKRNGSHPIQNLRF